MLSALRSREKISYQIATNDDVIETETGKLLVFYIPEVPRQHKPVYLNGDIRRSYIRRGAGDQRCNEDDIRRFLRAAGGPSYESETVDVDLTTSVDASTLGGIGSASKRSILATSAISTTTPTFWSIGRWPSEPTVGFGRPGRRFCSSAPALLCAR